MHLQAGAGLVAVVLEPCVSHLALAQGLAGRSELG